MTIATRSESVNILELQFNDEDIKYFYHIFDNRGSFTAYKTILFQGKIDTCEGSSNASITMVMKINEDDCQHINIHITLDDFQHTYALFDETIPISIYNLSKFFSFNHSYGKYKNLDVVLTKHSIAPIEE